jgi:hypothetical protein
MLCLSNGFKEFVCGMLLGITDDSDTDTEARGGGTLGDCFRRVIGAFGMDIRAENFEEGLDVRLIEKDDVIDGAKRRDEERTGVFIENGTTGALESANDRVGVHAGD